MSDGVQSIIVYRNPIEKQIWENRLVLPIISVVVTFFIVTWIGMKIVDSFKFPHFSKSREYSEKAVILIALAAGFGVLFYLF